MHAPPPTRSAVPVGTAGPGRHRRIVLTPSRLRCTAQVIGRVGSVVSLAALTLLGMAVAASVNPVDEHPTITVTYDVQRR